MSEMVERIARKLCAGWGVDPSDTNGGAFDGGSLPRGEPAWKSWADEATEIIAEMRKPTPTMIEAGDNEPCEHSWGTHPEHGSSEFAYCEPIWQAMIDAALKP